MNDTFGDLDRRLLAKGQTEECATYPFVIEALDLLAENKVLEQSRAPFANAEAVLVRDRTADIRGHEGIIVIEVELRQELLGGPGSAAI